MSENLSKTQIWCTLGPSSLNEKIIKRLEESGVSMFRINLSHTPVEDIEDKVQEIMKHTNIPVCLDTEGPQIRTALVKDGKVYLKENTIVNIKYDSIIGDENNINLRPASILSELQRGDLISIDFDSALLSVIEKNGKDLKAKVICQGQIGNNKAVTIDRKITLPILSDKDEEAVKVIKKLGLKNYSLSFVNDREDVEYVRKLLGTDVRLISKIETTSALENLDGILDVSDGILIDRGDLSREQPINKIPLLQKAIIKKANDAGKQVVVATNFLESMVSTKKPLRSEVNDIMTTLLDGANGLVLAAETAIGKHPAECGNMVKRMIKYFEIAKQSPTLELLLQHDSFLLPEPHGGKLIDRFDRHAKLEEIDGLKEIPIDYRTLLDIEQIAIGTYSPLEGFLNKDDLQSVLDRYTLTDGTVWSIPIILQVDKDKYSDLTEGDRIALVYKYDNRIYGTMEIQELYKINLDDVAKKWFGTTECDHPGVNRLVSLGEFCVAGKITLIRRTSSNFKEFEYTPKQTRMIFEQKEWSKVAGFHTRNVIHRAHEYLQMQTLDKYNLDGLFLHPVVGPKKQKDFMPEVILESYRIMLESYYPKDKFVFGVFSGYSHYAGPREAVFTAICRKNFGCSHFIMGRDHAGVKDYYTKEDSFQLFEKIGDIGIKPIFFNQVAFCKELNEYMEVNDEPDREYLHISGTEAREMFMEGNKPPEWFLREEISQMILDKLKRGENVFVE